VSAQGTVFVVSGPSGAGKSTLLRRILAADPRVRFSISHTTRAPRVGEEDGRDYHFVERPVFEQMVRASAFLEWAEYNDHLYGTSRSAVEGPTREGVDLILEVEVQGAAQLRERLPAAVLVFIMPPSLEVLEQRLHERRSDDAQVIRKRLDRAREELRQINMYQYVIINDELERATQQLLHVIGAKRVERAKVLPGLAGSFDFG
jgi:guanylate kinase